MRTSNHEYTKLSRPSNSTTYKKSKGKIRRTAFVSQSSEIQKLPQSIEIVQPLNFVPLWRKDTTKIEIRTYVPDIEHWDAKQEVLRKLTMDIMEDAWTQIFTDGSDTDSVKVGWSRGTHKTSQLTGGNLFQANTITLF